MRGRLISQLLMTFHPQRVTSVGLCEMQGSALQLSLLLPAVLSTLLHCRRRRKTTFSFAVLAVPPVALQGCFPGADASKVSSRAKARGASQCGTLGSGNHYVEVQVTPTLKYCFACDSLLSPPVRFAHQPQTAQQLATARTMVLPILLVTKACVQTALSFG